jgi:hypothetical protein
MQIPQSTVLLTSIAVWACTHCREWSCPIRHLYVYQWRASQLMTFDSFCWGENDHQRRRRSRDAWWPRHLMTMQNSPYKCPFYRTKVWTTIMDWFLPLVSHAICFLLHHGYVYLPLRGQGKKMVSWLYEHACLSQSLEPLGCSILWFLSYYSKREIQVN